MEKQKKAWMVNGAYKLFLSEISRIFASNSHTKLIINLIISVQVFILA